MQITISGDIGSGKSTLGEYLSREFNAELIDCGQLYRKYAAEKSMSVLELNQSGDNSIDRQIDNDLIKWGRENKYRVYISRTAWHFIPDAVHIYTMVNPKLAAERILKRKTVAEEHTSIDSILEYNKKRIEEEDMRYQRMYGITRENQLRKTELFIHIGNNSPEQVCRAVSHVIKKERLVLYSGKPILIFDPRVVVPTQGIRDMNNDIVFAYSKDITADVSNCEVTMQLVDGVPYILDGHHRVAAACTNGVQFMYTTSFMISQKPDSILRNSDYYDWEEYTMADLSIVYGREENSVNGVLSAALKMGG